MASGDGVIEILEILPPAANFAARSRRAGGSTPAEGYPIWLFDQTTSEYLDFLCMMRGRSGGGGLTFRLPWTSTVTTGSVVWRIGIRRLDTAEDVDVAHTYDFNAASAAAAPGTAGFPAYTEITFTDGADMDNWANGEMAIVRVGRDTSGADDMAADAELWGLEGRET
jgi:hypothetical protein